MGKKRETSFEEPAHDSPSSSHKKHKKHKKKHKRKQHDDYTSETVADIGDSPKPSIKLKLKIGGETLATKSVQKVQETSDTSLDQIINVTDEPWDDETEEPIFATKKPGDDTSDEEREWLDALEKGELNDYGELKSNKDKKILTARQRALFHGQQEQELLQLPSGYKTVELTEEQLQRRQQRANKRRQQAQEKREKDKKQTLDRLLKKQASKSKSSKTTGSRKAETPRLRYSNNQSGTYISIPSGFQFPYPPQATKGPPPVTKCGMSGCQNDKKYSCSKTGVPLCSLECYKKNVSLNKTQFPPVVTT